jgi:hypothetical protein
VEPVISVWLPVHALKCARHHTGGLVLRVSRANFAAGRFCISHMVAFGNFVSISKAPVLPLVCIKSLKDERTLRLLLVDQIPPMVVLSACL